MADDRTNIKFRNPLGKKTNTSFHYGVFAERANISNGFVILSAPVRNELNGSSNL